MTGFEPATTRPPDVDSTGLSYIPKSGAKVWKRFDTGKANERKNIILRHKKLKGTY